MPDSKRAARGRGERFRKMRIKARQRKKKAGSSGGGKGVNSVGFNQEDLSADRGSDSLVRVGGGLRGFSRLRGNIVNGMRGKSKLLRARRWEAKKKWKGLNSLRDSWGGNSRERTIFTCKLRSSKSGHIFQEENSSEGKGSPPYLLVRKIPERSSHYWGKTF